MIVAAVVCPHPPLLLRELCGVQDAVPELRAACHDALRAALALGPEVVHVVGGGQLSRRWDARLPVDVHAFGTTDAPPVEGLPQSLGVGKRLLEEAGWRDATRMRTIAWSAPDDDIGLTGQFLSRERSRAVVLVLGDGSARRAEKAPGYLDERAFGYDEAAGRAFEAGDASGLAALDRELADELMVFGWSSFMVLAEAVAAQGGGVEADVTYRDDPYGVMYTVAQWRLVAPDRSEAGPASVSAD